MRPKSTKERRLVVPRLVGGLGNQLFQVVTAHAYARRTARTLKLPRRIRVGGRRRTYHAQLFGGTRTLGLLEGLTGRAVHAEPGFCYLPIPDYSATRLELAGYFQSARYFERDDVTGVLAPTPTLRSRAAEVLANLRQHAQGRPLVALHVRRGDYQHKRDYHPVLPLSYYREALASFDNDVVVALFSDDLPACQAQPLFSQRRSVTVPEPEDVCLLVMAGCDHHIIANSSFSWWGAYLAAGRGRVLAPARWFGPLGPPDTRDLLPPSWQVLPCP